MKNLLRSLKITLVVACFCYVSGVAIGFNNTAHADASSCVTRSGGNYICDCEGANCGKVCSRSISNGCENATCKDKPKDEIGIEEEGGSV
jgi:hypothetical protein